jgi:hypothetical protein
MPRADELPDSLVKLVRRQALELSPARFEFDTSRLLKVLDLTLAEVRTAQDDPALELAPAETVPDPTPGVVQETPAPPEQEQQRRPPAAVSPPGARPPSAGGGPPDKQRRRLSTRAWILAGVGVGVVLILLVVAIVANLQTTPSANEDVIDRQDATEAGGGIDVDSTPVTSPDEIRLTGLKAASGSDPASVGDTVTVSYSLTNVGDEPIQLEYTFVGVRDPAGENRDTEDMNEGRVLAPGETVNAQGRRLLDGAGSWEFWPCYVLSGERFCPDKWQAFEILAK